MNLDRYIIEVPTGCWVWTGLLNHAGYGRVHRNKLAHRVMYEACIGPIPAGLTLDHLCRQPPCVNPDHLEPVTLSENRRRSDAAQTHCCRGHSLSDDANVRRDGILRICRACERIRKQSQRQRKATES